MERFNGIPMEIFRLLFVLHILRSPKTKHKNWFHGNKGKLLANTVVSRAVVWRLYSTMIRPHKHSDLHCAHREHKKVSLIDSFISSFVLYSS